MLGEAGVDVYLSHSSLSAEERRRSEHAFAEARDCVIVATSTLELGIDVGDLDRMIQIGAPGSVSSFLQRLGRTGRRPGTVRNCLFIATQPDHLLRTLGLLHAWGRGYVEPVVPPPVPLHLDAQQIMAALFQEGTVPRYGWQIRWAASPLMQFETLERWPGSSSTSLLSAATSTSTGAPCSWDPKRKRCSVAATSWTCSPPLPCPASSRFSKADEKSEPLNGERCPMRRALSGYCWPADHGR